jgi:hypothetical protein
MSDAEVAQQAAAAGMAPQEYKSILYQLPHIHSACKAAAEKAARWDYRGATSMDNLYGWNINNAYQIQFTGYDLVFQNAFGTWPVKGIYECDYDLKNGVAYISNIE